MPFLPVKFKAKGGESVTFTIDEQGIRLEIIGSSIDASNRSFAMDWEEWERLINLIKALKP